MDEKQWSFASVALFWILVGAVLGMVMGVLRLCGAANRILAFTGLPSWAWDSICFSVRWHR